MSPRTQTLMIIKEIKDGKTFYRSSLPQTVANKMQWDEYKAEIVQGYSIDLPKATSAQRA